MQFLAKLKNRLRRLRAQIKRLPPYPALVMLAVPLAVAEPLKLATVFIAGAGHWIVGLIAMVFAYALSLFVTHWAVRPRKTAAADPAMVRARLGIVRRSTQQILALAGEKASPYWTATKVLEIVALSLGSLAALGEGQKSESASGETRGGSRVKAKE
jgi:hypothetical protein